VRKEGSTRDILARAIMLEILEGRGTPEGGVNMIPDPPCSRRSSRSGRST
jgi:hypothetical protein